MTVQIEGYKIDNENKTVNIYVMEPAQDILNIERIRLDKEIGREGRLYFNLNSFHFLNNFIIFLKEQKACKKCKTIQEALSSIIGTTIDYEGKIFWREAEA